MFSVGPLLCAALVVTLAATPRNVDAQSIGVAPRAGTLGLGADLGLELGGRLVMRGGVGVMPFEFSGTFDDIEMTLELPKTWYNVGLDLYLTSVMRLGGGVIFKSEGPKLSANPTAPLEIGNQLYTPDEIGTLTGTLDSGGQAPYVLVGFGKHTRGVGLTLDLGVAFQKETRVTLDASGGILSDDPTFRQELETEARNFEDDLPTYIDLWPILSLGVRIGLGG
jgi:hypothetical protein